MSVTGHWSEGSPVRRVTGPTVVVADVGTVSKMEDGNSMHINSVLVRDLGVSLNLRKHSVKKSTMSTVSVTGYTNIVVIE